MWTPVVRIYSRNLNLMLVLNWLRFDLLISSPLSESKNKWTVEFTSRARKQKGKLSPWGRKVNVAYVNGTAKNQVDTAISLNLAQGSTCMLNAQRTRKVTQMLSASPNCNAKAIEGGFIAFRHTDCDADIRAISGFIPVAEYGSRSRCARTNWDRCDPSALSPLPCLYPWKIRAVCGNTVPLSPL
jgi:hypothetical protein